MGSSSSMEKAADACRDQKPDSYVLKLIEEAKKEGTHNSKENMRSSEGRTLLAWIVFHKNAALLAAAAKALPPQEGNAMDPLVLDAERKTSALNDFCRRLTNDNLMLAWSRNNDRKLGPLVCDADLECLKLLLQLDPKRCNETLTHYRDPVNNLTPLQSLCALQAADGNEEAKKAVVPLAEELLSNGAEANPYYSQDNQDGLQHREVSDHDDNGKSPAAMLDHPDFTWDAENRQVPGALRYFSHMPPLSIAAASGNEHMVATLIAAGADVNARDADGRTAIMISAIYGYPECFKLLISQPKIDLIAEEHREFSTVLHFCIQQYRIRHKNAHGILPRLGIDMKPWKRVPLGQTTPIEEKPPVPFLYLLDPVDDPAKNGVDMRCMLQLLLAKNPQDRPPIALSRRAAAQMQKSFDENKDDNSMLYFRRFSPVCLAGFIKHVYFERNFQITMEHRRKCRGTIDEKVQTEIIELLKPHFDEEEKKKAEACLPSPDDDDFQLALKI